MQSINLFSIFIIFLVILSGCTNPNITKSNNIESDNNTNSDDNSLISIRWNSNNLNNPNDSSDNLIPNKSVFLEECYENIGLIEDYKLVVDEFVFVEGLSENLSFGTNNIKSYIKAVYAPEKLVDNLFILGKSIDVEIPLFEIHHIQFDDVSSWENELNSIEIYNPFWDGRAGRILSSISNNSNLSVSERNKATGVEYIFKLPESNTLIRARFNSFISIAKSEELLSEFFSKICKASNVIVNSQLPGNFISNKLEIDKLLYEKLNTVAPDSFACFSNELVNGFDSIVSDRGLVLNKELILTHEDFLDEDEEIDFWPEIYKFDIQTFGDKIGYVKYDSLVNELRFVVDGFSSYPLDDFSEKNFFSVYGNNVFITNQEGMLFNDKQYYFDWGTRNNVNNCLFSTNSFVCVELGEDGSDLVFNDFLIKDVGYFQLDEKKGVFDSDFQQIKLFDNILMFKDINNRIKFVIDKNIFDLGLGFNPVVFGKHYAFIQSDDQSSNIGKVVYDGNILDWKSDKVVLFEDNFAFVINGNKTCKNPPCIYYNNEIISVPEKINYLGEWEMVSDIKLFENHIAFIYYVYNDGIDKNYLVYDWNIIDEGVDGFFQLFEDNLVYLKNNDIIFNKKNLGELYIYSPSKYSTQYPVIYQNFISAPFTKYLDKYGCENKICNSYYSPSTATGYSSAYNNIGNCFKYYLETYSSGNKIF